MDPNEDRTKPAAAPWARAEERAAMVERQLRGRDIEDAAVLRAMEAVPRHRFVPRAYAQEAYEDGPLPIGFDVTISQPYIVATMTQAARVRRGARVLDVGSGSGYQAAVLAELGADVYGVEIIEPLVARARQTLAELGYIGDDAPTHVEIRHGDGYAGWPEHAPFDAIIVAAAAPRVPEALVEQLAVGGRLVIPVGEGSRRRQVLLLVEKTPAGVVRTPIFDVRFVPMTGEIRGE